jgi:hypothetical protein
MRSTQHPGHRQTSQRFPNTPSSLFQFVPASTVRVAGSESQAEAISIEAREDVQMDVEDLLSCRLTVGQEKIDPVAIEPALVESNRNPLGGTEHVGTSLFGQIGQARRVILRHHENVTGIDGLDVHKRRAASVAQDDARRQLARKYPAENTAVHNRHYVIAAVSEVTIRCKS